MIRRSNFIVVALVIGLGILFGNCSKSKQRNYVELDSDSGVITHFNFKPGTYWIFKDTISGRIDSFFVRSNVYSAQTESYTVYNYHFITIAEQNYDNTNPGDSATWVLNYQGVEVQLDYNYGVDPFGWKNQIQYRPLFRYPFLWGDQKSKYDTASIVTVDSFRLVNGNGFYNVAHVNHVATPSPGAAPYLTPLNDWFYVNDSVGLVEIRIDHPDHSLKRAWKVLRYNIVR